MPFKTGTVHLPLHGGKAPAWLFRRMVDLGKKISEIIIMEQGKEEFIRKLSDPFWFQSLGCVLGFDWHSSGVTTTVCGALKSAFSDIGPDLGIFVAGGKGKAGIKTPLEIKDYAMRFGINEGEKLIHSSRLSAKIDSAAVQDGFQIYHHSFFFTDDAKWVVVQQGMSDICHDNKTGWARRYHWWSGDIKSFESEPHKAVCSDIKTKTLNFVCNESEEARKQITEISKTDPDKIIHMHRQASSYHMPSRHKVSREDINPKHLSKILLSTYRKTHPDFSSLLLTRGLGAKSLRALALVSEVIYSKPVAFKDPARYSFAHGGKDGTPYPVDLTTYRNTIMVLEKAVKKIKCDRSEKGRALRRLHKLFMQ